MITSVFYRYRNNVAKGENAGYQHFLFFQQFFSTVDFARSLTLSQKSPLFMRLQYKSFGNTLGKEETA